MKKYILSITLCLGSLFLVPYTVKAQYDNSAYAQAPTVGFQSTSSMVGSGSSYASNPSLNSDGTAMLNSPSRIGAARRSPGGGGTGKTDVDNPGLPIGDEMVPMLVMAVLCAGVVLLRRKLKIEK